MRPPYDVIVIGGGHNGGGVMGAPGYNAARVMLTGRKR